MLDAGANPMLAVELGRPVATCVNSQVSKRRLCRATPAADPC
jgi:hypothetical protein